MSFTSLFLCWLVQFSGELIVNHSLGNRVVLRTDNCAEGMGTSRGKKKEEKGGKKVFFICNCPSIPLFLLQYIYGRTWGLRPAQLSTVCWRRSSVSSSTLAISCKLTTGCWGLIQFSVDHFDIGGGCGLIRRLKMAAGFSMWQICVLRGKNLWPHVKSRLQRSNREDKLVLLC